METVLYEGDTEHDHYAVIERIYEGRPARVLFSGRGRAAQSGVALDDDSDLLFDYNQRFLELIGGLYPKRLLVIGGGAFTLPMALVAALPDLAVDVVEVDAGLTAIAEKFFELKTSERLRIVNQEGRQFLDSSNQLYDMIVIDAFAHLTIPRSLTTLEAARAMRDHLSAEGCIALNIISAYQGRATGLIKSQLAAYRQLFAQVEIFPAARGLTSWLPQNLLLVALKQVRSDLDKFLRFEALSPLAFSEADIIHDDN